MKSKGVTAAMKDIEIVNDESSVPTVHLHFEAKAGATGKFKHFTLFTDLKSFFFVSLFVFCLCLLVLTCATWVHLWDLSTLAAIWARFSYKYITKSKFYQIS